MEPTDCMIDKYLHYEKMLEMYKIESTVKGML